MLLERDIFIPASTRISQYLQRLGLNTFLFIVQIGSSLKFCVKLLEEGFQTAKFEKNCVREKRKNQS